MGSYNTAVITTVGQALLTSVLGAQGTMTFTKLQTSSYAYASGTDLSALTSLNNVEQEESVTAGVIDSTHIYANALISNTGVSTEYNANTLGIFASDGVNEVLFAVSTAVTPDVIPVDQGGTPSTYKYKFTLAVSSTSDITITSTSDIDATDVSYDNTASGLNATNVQTAIDEVAQIIPKLVIGNTYTFGGFEWTAAEDLGNGCVVLQSQGMTAGTWPAYKLTTDYTGTKNYGSANTAYNDNIDGDNIANYNSITRDWYERYKSVEKTGQAFGAGLFLVNKSKCNVVNPSDMGSGNYTKGLAKAGSSYSSFGASYGNSWIGNHQTGGTFAWDIGYTNNNGYGNYHTQSSNYVIAPAFNLDTSKVQVLGTDILVKGESLDTVYATQDELSNLVLTGTTNTSGATIAAGTCFVLNGDFVVAKTAIASGATFTLNTNYEKKSVGSILTELNSKTSVLDKGTYNVPVQIIFVGHTISNTTYLDCFIPCAYNYSGVSNIVFDNLDSFYIYLGTSVPIKNYVHSITLQRGSIFGINVRIRFATVPDGLSNNTGYILAYNGNIILS